jgi:hypothetical protein
VNPDAFNSEFLTGVIGVCALGTILNIVMIRKRGTNAILMAIAFLAFGAAVALYKAGAPILLVGLMGAVVVGILIAELILRAKKSGSKS